MRILIIGSSKTGSTALAYRLKAALPSHVFYFEPSALEEVSKDNPDIIVKYLKGVEPNKLQGYDRIILLIRHPFDIVTSQTLFLPNGRPEILAEGVAARCLRVLADIERGRPDVGLRDIWELCLPTMSVHLQAISDGLKAASDLKAETGSALYEFRYEEMVEGNFEGLSRYLGVPLVKREVIDGVHSHVARTKGTADWKNWFNIGDVEYFKKMIDVATYARVFGYRLEFDSCHKRTPNPKTGSEYFLNLLNSACMMWGIPLFDPSRGRNSAADAHYRIAIVAHNAGENETALTNVVAALSKAGEQAEYLSLLAACAYRMELYELARQNAIAALRIHAKLPFAWSVLAGCMSVTGELIGARDALLQSAALASNGLRARFQLPRRLVDVCLRLKDFRSAEVALEGFINDGNDTAENRALLAEVLHEQGRPKEALRNSEIALEKEAAKPEMRGQCAN